MRALGLCLALAAAPSPAPPPDTTVAVHPGAVLVAETLMGVLSVRVWERDEVLLEGDGRSLVGDGNRLRLVERPGRAFRRDAVRLTVPPWMELRVAGDRLDVDVAGLAGRLTVVTTAGEVLLADTGGDVTVTTVSGGITARRVGGRTQLTTVEGRVEVAGASGRLGVGSTDGDLVLTEAALEWLAAETTDGDVSFQGRVLPGSQLRLATHAGDVDVVIPRDTGAEVSVSTFDGVFHAGFPVETRSFRAGESVRFLLGGGGGQLEVRAFDGDIRFRHGNR